MISTPSSVVTVGLTGRTTMSDGLSTVGRTCVQNGVGNTPLGVSGSLHATPSRYGTGTFFPMTSLLTRFGSQGTSGRLIPGSRPLMLDRPITGTHGLPAMGDNYGGDPAKRRLPVHVPLTSDTARSAAIHVSLSVMSSVDPAHEEVYRDAADAAVKFADKNLDAADFDSVHCAAQNLLAAAALLVKIGALSDAAETLLAGASRIHEAGHPGFAAPLHAERGIILDDYASRLRWHRSMLERATEEARTGSTIDLSAHSAHRHPIHLAERVRDEADKSLALAETLYLEQAEIDAALGTSLGALLATTDHLLAAQMHEQIVDLGTARAVAKKLRPNRSTPQGLVDFYRRTTGLQNGWGALEAKLIHRWPPRISSGRV